MGLPILLKKQMIGSLKGYDLIVDYDEKNDEPAYQFEANQEDLTK